MKKNIKRNSLFLSLAIISLTSCTRNSRECNLTSSSDSTSISSNNSTSSTISSSSSSSSSVSHNHTYKNWEIVTKPTFTSVGKIEKKCVDKDDTISFELPILNDTDYSYSLVKESTCTTKGSEKYVYTKDLQDLEIEVELALDSTNHVCSTTSGYCKECNKYLYLSYDNYDDENKTCDVSGYDESSEELKDIVVPKTVIKDDIIYNVVGFKSYLFVNSLKNGATLKSIKLPSSMSTLSSCAFYGCTALESVDIPKTITTIATKAFYSCSSLKSIVVPNSVTTIEANAFYYCSALKTITLPKNLTSINEYTFFKCYNLESIDIPNTVTSIGASAFYNCTSLKTVIIPDNTTSIGKNAFYSCTSLSLVVMPNDINLLSAENVFGPNKVADVFLKATVDEYSVDVLDKLGPYCNKIYFYSESKLTYTNCWHYDQDNNPVKWGDFD